VTELPQHTWFRSSDRGQNRGQLGDQTTPTLERVRGKEAPRLKKLEGHGYIYARGSFLCLNAGGWTLYPYKTARGREKKTDLEKKRDRLCEYKKKEND